MIRMMALLLVSVGFWQVGGMAAGVREPWDAAGYWTYLYPASLILSALAGFLMRRHGWLAGAVVTFAQLPVMWINAAAGSLWAAGLLILCLLAIPAMAVSWLASWLARRRSRA